MLAALAGALLGCASFAGAALAAAPGSFDGSFGSGGVVSVGAGIQLYAVAAQPDGGVVVAGQSGGRVLVQRLGPQGQTEGAYLGPAGQARAVAAAAGGKIVIAGSGGAGMLVERLTSALAPDPSFGSGGVASVYPGGVANGVAVGADGSVAVAGSAGGPSAAVAGFSASGALRWTQGGFGGSAELNAVTIQPDEKVVVVGVQFTNQFTNGLVARLTSGGALDSSFRHTGAFLYEFPNSGYTSLNAVTVQNNGQIVASGVAKTPDAGVVRFNPDGSLDGTFGVGGSGELSSGNLNVPEYPYGAFGVGIGGGGRIIAAGNFGSTGVSSDNALYAFTSGGAPEAAFVGGGGTISGGTGTVRGPTGIYEACGMAVDPSSGNIVTVGDTVAGFPVDNPCGLDISAPSGTGSSSFVARFVGFGPPPTPAPPGAAPAVLTGGASNVGRTSAHLAGAVTPNLIATSFHFDYGRTPAYGSSTAAAPAGSGAAPVGGSATITGLAPGTTYHYRLVASNGDGTAYGADRTFVTLPGSAPPPQLHVTVSRTARYFSSATLTKQGFALRLTCTKACTVTGSLEVPTATVKRLHLGRHRIVLATGSTRLRRAGSGRVVVRLSRTGKRLVAGLRGVDLSLQITIRPAAGGRALTVSRKLTLNH